MLRKILEMQQLLRYDDYQWTDDVVCAFERLTGVFVTAYPVDHKHCKQVLQKKLYELLETPVYWCELIEVLENMKVDLGRLS